MCDQESNVLIVCDQQTISSGYGQLLLPLNITAYHACTASDILRQILQHHFSLILLDNDLKDHDSYETAALIHGNNQFEDIPIVILADAHDPEHHSSRLSNCRAVHYIPKPIAADVFVNTIQALIESHHKQTAPEPADSEQQTAAKMQALLNSAGEGILGIDLGGQISFANPKACELLKVNHKKLLTMNLQDFLYTESDPIFDACTNLHERKRCSQADIVSLLNVSESTTADKERWVTATGKPFYVEYSCECTTDKQGHRDGGVVMFQNVSERRANEENLVRLANFDPLTNLANRAYFHDALSRAIARSKRTRNSLALLFLDLDHFKHINDNLGHDAGDILLQEVSKKITQCIRAGDLAARIGGDEFAVILHDVYSITAVSNIAKKIITSIQQPIDIHGNTVGTSTSIGIAVYDDFSIVKDEFVKAADTAMYAAKKQGRSCFRFFESEMQERAEERARIQITLNEAIHNNELSIYYQPKISLKDKRVVGMEALLRWKNDKGQQIPPDVFIPIAEESGQIQCLGTWVLTSVCQQISRWSHLPGFEELAVSINVSALQFKNNDFFQTLKSVLREYSFKPKHLELELTETAIMSDPDMASRQLQAIHDLGIQISIDDFGTGYSSLNHLKRLPIDVLKIDQCFIQEIGDDHNDEDIIKIVVAIAHTMGVEVIAEGVDNPQQLEFLASVGCDLVQGFLFSKPLSCEATTKIIKRMANTSLPRFDGTCHYANRQISPEHEYIGLEMID